VFLFCATGLASRDADPVPSGADSEVIRRFEQLIREELQRGLISGVSVALVDDQRVVYSHGFGLADKKRQEPARPDTIYRAGSISKLFTALAAMQLAEQGKLDIDQPVTRYLPTLGVVSPFPDAGPMTLRQLMCHRSGLVREAPVGGYFDDSDPGTERTVGSLSGCVLVYPPGRETKYSNSGVTLVGHVVETVAGASFPEYQQRHLLGPIGMDSSAFRMSRALRPRLAKGYLPVADGQGGFCEIEAPPFELGIIPAGNLYTTAEDLARFLAFLFAQGRTASQQLIQAETLARMFTPQLTRNTNGFGLGFSIGHVRGRKTVNHTGAVYGFTSLISGMPAEKLGVVVLCNDDIATGPVRRLAAAGLNLLLETRLGEKMPAPAATATLSSEELQAFAGDYESESWWAELKPAEGLIQANISGQRMTFRPVGPLKFEASGRVAHESPGTFERDAGGRMTGFTVLEQQFRRVDPATVHDIPPEWRKFLGRYGPDFIPLIVTVKHGHLYAMTENEFDNRLWPLNRTVFKMPPGLYTGEHLVFQMDARDRVHTAVLANMPLRRRTGAR
jgi:serine beta-lactamase-like protein LACTB